ncbi:hypothetical protein CLS_35280 [[Clostridium] cf. saccharolyticum K10]|nr:hypothetical protein CLS_35280 [[Clostridium] cf. saccharolyticum K10]
MRLQEECFLSMEG